MNRNSIDRQRTRISTTDDTYDEVNPYIPSSSSSRQQQSQSVVQMHNNEVRRKRYYYCRFFSCLGNWS